MPSVPHLCGTSAVQAPFANDTGTAPVPCLHGRVYQTCPAEKPDTEDRKIRLFAPREAHFLRYFRCQDFDTELIYKELQKII